MKRNEFASEAMRLINGDRQDQYGPASLNFMRIANRWSQQTRHHFEPATVALLMAEVKLARLAEGYKRDSVIDAIGYLALYGELEEAGHGETEIETAAGLLHTGRADETKDPAEGQRDRPSDCDATESTLGE